MNVASRIVHTPVNMHEAENKYIQVDSDHADLRIYTYKHRARGGANHIRYGMKPTIITIQNSAPAAQIAMFLMIGHYAPNRSRYVITITDNGEQYECLQRGD